MNVTRFSARKNYCQVSRRKTVVRKMDDAPIECLPFGSDDKAQAIEIWEKMQLNWTECYLCEIIDNRKILNGEY